MKTLILLMLLSTQAIGSGLFEDGFAPSDLGDAIRHVGGRIRNAHSGGNGNSVDFSALKNMTPEQRDKIFMVQVDDPERRENDSRRETLAMWEKFLEDLIVADFSDSRREEIAQHVEREIEDYKRHIEGGFYRYHYEKYDQCLSDCSHMSEEKEIACYSTEIDKRIECESKILINPNRHYCNYQTKKESDKCRDAASWDYQVCQAKCFK